jgi:cytosine/adenosine deaminase-related metal-dependent hydrolase
MSFFRAAWLLPISRPPIRDAWLQTDRGRIVAFGHWRPGRVTSSGEIDLGAVAVLPGVVNAHTHLELSWMRERIPETGRFDDWIRAVLAMRGQEESFRDRDATVGEAIREARAFGTAVIGDISNTLASAGPLIEEQMPAVVFHELLGFQSSEAERIFDRAIDETRRIPMPADVRVSLAPHASYSVSPVLFRLIGSLLQQDPLARSSVHLGEWTAEVEFLFAGTGTCRAILEELGKWDSSWVPPRCRPVEYVDRLGFLNERSLLVHGVQFSSADLAKVSASGATLVTCPRGNIRTGAGTPPVADFFQAGVQVAVGTDSLASVQDLNVFAELARMRALAPSVPAQLLLESATINGARALGFQSDFGTIDPGKRDALIAVELDGRTSDVEEYLVSGVDAAQLRWLPAS